MIELIQDPLLVGLVLFTLALSVKNTRTISRIYARVCPEGGEKK